MQYMLLLHTEPFESPRPGEPGFDDYMAPWLAYNEGLRAQNALVAAGVLAPRETATTIRRTYGGGDTILDGPFAESKEVLGGYYIVEAPDLDAALEMAAALPLPAGSFEVRPLAMTSAA